MGMSSRPEIWFRALSKPCRSARERFLYDRMHSKSKIPKPSSAVLVCLPSIAALEGRYPVIYAGAAVQHNCSVLCRKHVSERAGGDAGHREVGPARNSAASV